MWKPGQLVTLWGNVYRITKCDGTAKYRVCSFCTRVGNCAPCLKAHNFPTKKGFNMMSCVQNVPDGCYPKKVSK